MADTITIHTANVDTTTPKPYNEVLVSTIAGYSGYHSHVINVLGGFKSLSLEGEKKQYVDGEIRGLLYLRHNFDVKVAPFAFHSRDWDLNDLNDLETTILRMLGKHTWIELTAIGEFLHISYPYHTAGKAIPVDIVGMDFEGDDQKSIVLHFQKKWRQS